MLQADSLLEAVGRCDRFAARAQVTGHGPRACGRRCGERQRPFEKQRSQTVMLVGVVAALGQLEMSYDRRQECIFPQPPPGRHRGCARAGSRSGRRYRRRRAAPLTRPSLFDGLLQLRGGLVGETSTKGEQGVERPPTLALQVVIDRLACDRRNPLALGTLRKAAVPFMGQLRTTDRQESLPGNRHRPGKARRCGHAEVRGRW